MGGDGKGGYFVCEADESDGSFLYLTPSIAVVTNVEADPSRSLWLNRKC